jgi:hypothetical protein
LRRKREKRRKDARRKGKHGARKRERERERAEGFPEKELCIIKNDKNKINIK